MNIYLIKREEGRILWDEFESHVVVANNKTQVIETAKKQIGTHNENPDEWDSETVTIEKFGKYEGNRVTPFIILSSYKNG